MTCDLATRALGTDLFSDRIFLSFGRRKYGGANSNSTGFMALPKWVDDPRIGQVHFLLTYAFCTKKNT
jgi:hypothetical protein